MTGVVQRRASRGVLLPASLAVSLLCSTPQASGESNGAILNGHALAPAAVNAINLPPDETMLVEALGDLRRDGLDPALARLERLIERNPDFHLARLVYADLLLAKSGAIRALGGADRGGAGTLEDLRAEARARLAYRANAARLASAGSLPAELLRLAPEQRRAVVVDISAARLYVFENRDGQAVLTESRYVSVGKNGSRKRAEGDQRTPVGVYFVVTRLPGDRLPDLYGSGALPVNYPNEWDLRQGRTGYGIWLHGVPSNTYSRAPRSSDGCLAMPNVDLKALWGRVDLGLTPVVIADRLEWVPARRVHDRARELEQAVEQWRSDWAGLDTDRYLEHYSGEFRDGSGKDLGAWSRRKKRVNAAKTWIEVELSNLSMLGYPDEQDLVAVTFDQTYRSSNYSTSLRKRQYWRKEPDGRWRIVYEGEARTKPSDFRGIPYSARALGLSN